MLLNTSFIFLVYVTSSPSSSSYFKSSNYELFAIQFLGNYSAYKSLPKIPLNGKPNDIIVPLYNNAKP
jgi:hypothetical protein